MFKYLAIKFQWQVFNINNLIYVVILSAAVDLVGAEVPKGVVLLADIIPSLLVKMVAPYFIHKVSYPLRVVFCASLSFLAVVIIALSDTISGRMLGVTMASLSSGLGELTFLMLTSFYRLQMVSAWSSGTGGAGLLGAFLFLLLTSWIGLSIRRTLGIIALFPILMLVAYFFILTNPTSRSSLRGITAANRPLSSSYQILDDGHDIEEELLTSQESLQPHQTSVEVSATATATAVAEELNGASPSQYFNGNSNHGHRRGGSTDSNTLLQTPASVLSTSTQDTAPVSNVASALLSSDPYAPILGTSTAVTPPAMLPIAPWDTHWGTSSSQRHQTEPTSINTLLAATDPDDPEFVPPFRESEVRDRESSVRRTVYKVQPNEAMTLEEKFTMLRSLLVPYMIPLFMVYIAEYTMNQGVLPVILFPLENTPFAHLRDHYVTYSAIYQTGVFISRSSASLIQISHLWIPSFLQVLTLLLATSQAILTSQGHPFPIPSIYLIFILILWEGLLGGATYVHTYIGISRDLEHDPKGKEFAMGAVGVADGLGVMIAGIASLWIEPALCRWQVVEKGIELCLAMAD
ncbi:battenin CLN3 protein [Lobosporangium transversale]|nr:battenin CLN3 protein [Lobosporangium transversale]